MPKSQSFLPCDVSTLANYVTWAKGISDALYALGWRQTADVGQANWTTILASGAIPFGIPYANSWGGCGTWSSGVYYNGTAIAGTGTVTAVTYNGGGGNLTYACLGNTGLAISDIIQNTAQAIAVTGQSNGSGTPGVFIFTGATGLVANALVGQQFTLVNGTFSAANVVTGMCYSNTTTSITIYTSASFVPVVDSTKTGNLTSYSTVFSYKASSAAAPNIGQGTFVGHTFITSNFGLPANNGVTVTIQSNSGATTGYYYYAGTVSGSPASAGGQAGLIVETTVPPSDTIHWAPYNYEIWQTQDTQNSTNPIYLRLNYNRQSVSYTSPFIAILVGTQTTGTGWVQGNALNSNIEINLYTSGTNGGGAVLYECDFHADVTGGSLAMLLFRTAGVSQGLQSYLVIERSRDNNGNPTDAYVHVYYGESSINGNQTLFKPGTGGVSILNSGWPFIELHSGSVSTNSTAYGGSAAASPVFPMPGFIGNPGLEIIIMRPNDAIEGSLVNCIIYGNTHTYLMSKPATLTTNLSYSNGCFIGIRYET